MFQKNIQPVFHFLFGRVETAIMPLTVALDRVSGPFWVEVLGGDCSISEAIESYTTNRISEIMCMTRSVDCRPQKRSPQPKYTQYSTNKRNGPADTFFVDTHGIEKTTR